MPTTDRLRDGIVSGYTETGNVMDPAAVFVGLFVSGPTADPPATVADFVLPDATDMPAQAVGTWAGPLRMVDGSSMMEGEALLFRLPDADNAFTAGGYYYADALTAGNILEWTAFAEPIPMPDATAAITIVPRTLAPLNVRWDADVIISG